MTNVFERIRRREYLKIGGGLATVGALTGLAGCVDEAPATGTLATRVKDQPGDIDDFESCVVTLEGMWLKPAGGGDPGEDDATDDGGEHDGADDGEDDEAGNETAIDRLSTSPDDDEAGPPTGNETGPEADDGEDGDGDDDGDDGTNGDDEPAGEGRFYVEFDEPQEADLVELQDGKSQLVDERELEVDEFQFVQLDVTGVEGILLDGEEAVVETPGNAPLMFNESFEIREGVRTIFVADFVPVRRGTGEYLIQPVARGTEVIYEDDGGDDDGGDDDGGDDDGGDDDGGDDDGGDDDGGDDDGGDDDGGDDDGGDDDGGDDDGEDGA